MVLPLAAYPKRPLLGASRAVAFHETRRIRRARFRHIQAKEIIQNQLVVFIVNPDLRGEGERLLSQRLSQSFQVSEMHPVLLSAFFPATKMQLQCSVAFPASHSNTPHPDTSPRPSWIKQEFTDSCFQNHAGVPEFTQFLQEASLLSR